MKCIHIDMDCFYAAIEERDNPELRGKPIAVGGSSRRGVLCTANYEARKFGCRSAMPGFKALELCPQLIMLPVRMEAYKAESQKIRTIFQRFTEKIEPLSLDEAYLDISHLRSSSYAVAAEIRAQIFEETGLTASAGIGPNKMIAKIASDWNKPNGQFEVKQDEVDDFMRRLPAKKLWGIGKQSMKRLADLGIETCADIQKYSKIELYQGVGKWAVSLYELSRGIDNRRVTTARKSKSISNESTFSENLQHPDEALPHMERMITELEQSIARKHSTRGLKSLVVKLKFEDFTQTTAEKGNLSIDRGIYHGLLQEAWSRYPDLSVRLLGVGVRFQELADDSQLQFFDNLEGTS